MLKNGPSDRDYRAVGWEKNHKGGAKGYVQSLCMRNCCMGIKNLKVGIVML